MKAIRLAVSKARQSGRLSHDLQIVPFDDRGDASSAQDVANLVVSKPEIVAVIGHLHSEAALRAAPIYAKARVPLLLPGATHPELTLAQLAPDWPGQRNVFRFLPHDGTQGRILAEFAFDRLKRRRMAVVHDGTPYGLGLAELVRSRFLNLGGAVPHFETVAKGGGGEKEAARKIKDSDAVFFGGIYLEGGLLLKELRGSGWEGDFLAGDGAIRPEFFDVAGASAQGAYFSTPEPDLSSLPEAKKFQEEYRAAYDGESPGIYDYFAYDAAETAIDALSRAAQGRSALLDALALTDRRGILGRTRFDSKGDVLERGLSVLMADQPSRSFLAVPQRE